MRTPMLWSAACVLLIGCSRPPEAPGELSEIAGFLFERFDDRNPQDIALAVQNLQDWLGDNLEAATGDDATDGYSVDDLTLETLRSVRPDVEPSSDTAIAGAAVATPILCNTPDIATTLVFDEQEDVFPSTEVHDRTFIEGEDCFDSRRCDQSDTTNYVESNFSSGLLTTITDSRAQYRWVDFGEEGNEQTALLHRTWLEAPAETGGIFGGAFNLNEQIYLGVIMPWEGGAMQLGTTWVAAEILGGIEDGFALNQMVNGMRNNAEAIEEYLECAE